MYEYQNKLYYIAIKLWNIADSHVAEHDKSSQIILVGNFLLLRAESRIVSCQLREQIIEVVMLTTREREEGVTMLPYN